MAARKYIYISAAILVFSAVVAIYLSFQDVRCLSDLLQIERSNFAPAQLEETERNCSIVTNSYVYSIYGVVSGVMLVFVGFIKKEKTMILKILRDEIL